VDELRRSLKAGARLIVLHPFVQGYLANDELLWPLLDALAGSPVPVYVHTGPPGNATPWQVVDLAERYTFLDFIMGHCGATDFWPDVIPAATAARNIYLESSLSRPFQFATYARTLGKHRCIMGSYAPLNELVMEWEHMRRHLPPAEWGDIYGGTLLRLLQKGGAI
jgi:predicted TIM-barrel fold metal-dependent hydrolase